MMTRQPTYYIPHGGGPCFFMEDPHHTWTKMGEFLRDLPQSLPKKPTAIVIISGHWESNPVRIHHHPAPSLYYDYYNFPEHTYHLQYPASSNPMLAEKIQTLLTQNHIPSQFEEDRGWDHGVFIPLKVMFPNADIPIVQLSLHESLDPKDHIAMGQAISPLRDENILILGSGMSYHNLPHLFSGHETKDAFAFDEWLTTAVTHTSPSERNNLLSHWEKAPGARSSHPRAEHLLPLMVVAGAANQDIGHCIFNDKILNKPISGFQFGSIKQ